MALTTKQAPAGQLKRPHFHLVWKPAGQPNASWKWQLFGYYWRETPRRLNLVFAVRGLLIWMASLSFAAYLVGAAVLVTLWSRSPYNQVGYFDVVLPTRWSDLRALRGKGLIAEGIAEIKAKRYAIGIMRLTQGVARNPKDFTGRLELARIYAHLGRIHQAQQLLSEGIDYEAPPKAFRETLFTITSYLEDYQGILSLLDDIQVEKTPLVRRELLGWRAIALEKLQRDDELDTLRRQLRGETPSVAVEAAWARSRIARGDAPAALAEVRKDRERFGTPTEALELQLNLAIASRDSVAGEEALALWRQIDPTGAIPRIREIILRCKFDQRARAKEKISEFFALYSADPAASPMLMRDLTTLSDPSWLTYAFAEAKESGTIPVALRIYYVQGLMLAGELQEARAQLLEAEKQIKALKSQDGEWITATKRLLDAAESPSESTTASLVDYFTTRRLNPDGYRFVWQVLAKAKSFAAMELAEIARNRFPQIRLAVNEDQLVQGIPQIKSHAESAREATTLARPKSDRTAAPPRPVITEAAARNELRQVDLLIEGGKFTDASDVLSRIERANLNTLRTDLQFRRIMISGELSELTELTSSLLLYLRSPGVNQTALRSLAEKWNNPSHRESALILLRETRTKFPGAKWAIDMQKEIERTFLLSPVPNVTSPQG